MIDFRYFLVTIAAVFLAIATGLVLGAGPLGDTGHPNASARPSSEELRERLARVQQRASYAEQVATATGARTLRDRLDGRRVAVVALPGADGRIVRELTDQLPTAGASVTRSLQVTEKWVDPRQQQFLDDLSADLVTDEIDLPKRGSTYDRAATVLASAVLGDPATTESDPAPPAEEASDTTAGSDAANILGAYDEGDLVRSSAPGPPAELTVLVGPDPEEHHPNVDRSDGAPWLALARAFDRAGDGAVVVGPAAAARGAGAIAVIRSDAASASEVSTVDVADRSVGRAVVLLALVEQAQGRAGHYGMVGPVDGALPG